MKKLKIWSILICFFALANFVFGQNYGIAVEESGFAAKVNPAALGFGNASGIGFYQEFEKNGLSDTYSLFFNLSNFSYGLDSVSGDYFNNISLAYKAFDGISFGATGRWGWEYDGIDFGLSSVIRPFSFFSFGVKTTDITGSVNDISMGVGLRPLVFSNYWRNRVTLYLDTQASDALSPLAYGLILEPINGIKIRGDFDHDNKTFNAGIVFNTRFLSTAVNSELHDNPFEKGNFSLFASAKQMRTVVPPFIKTMAVYKKANVINDFPLDRSFMNQLVQPKSNKGISLLEFINDMEMIKKDPDIKAVLFKDQSFITSFANIVEISKILSEVKASGKKIYFYFESASFRQYVLAASVADKIYLSPQGSIYLRGFSRTGLYFSNFFAKFGIKFYNFRSHEYKIAYNNLSEPGMTQEELEALDSLYSSLQQELELMLTSGRGTMLSGNIKDIIAKGPYLSSKEALKAGLIDARLYTDEFDKLISKEKYSVVNYSYIPDFVDYDWENIFAENVAIIYISGNIITGNGIKGRNAGATSVAKAISSARNNSAVKVIILRINSGGGSALASDIIAHEVMLCRESDNPKPVIVSMGGTAASGGYYIAAAAEKIFAQSVTITGSIGVIAIYPDISGLLEKLDIKSETVKSSESADFGNFMRSMTEDEREKIRSFIAESYDQFVTVVSAGRKISYEDVDKIAKGRVWTGKQAKEISLVDNIGGLSDVISYVESKYLNGKKAKVIEIVPGERNLSLINMFRLDSVSKLEDMPKITKALFDFLKKTDYYEEGSPLYLMPYTIEELGLE
ncbi:MAG: signal peptide peptidase SppA [Spirochaetaceae bacterium]|nr:signal peptide peptidase SppA [Spirochaetaceae bacterium]